MFRCSKVPEKLQPVIERWNHQGKQYYLGADNIFIYNQHMISYHGGEDIPITGWFAQNGSSDKSYRLTKSDVEEIQWELLQYFQTTRWTLFFDWHCNYQCPMCPYHGNGVLDKENYFEDKGEQKKVVLKEEAIKRIDQLAEYGIKTLIVMSSGEILLYPYWHDVSEYAHGKGMDLWTITNGSLWTEEVVKEAAALGYTNIRVSLDAVSFETYSKVRSRIREHYECAMRLPELLMKYGITTNVHFVRQEENLHEVQAFLEYWKSKEVDSISIANEFIFDDQVVVNKFAKSNKEYIEGMCTEFGKMQTFVAGNTVCCCGMNAQGSDGGRKLEIEGCGINVKEVVNAMRTDDSGLRKLCRKCAFYVPYCDETITDDGKWKVRRNFERETWIKMPQKS